MLLNGARTACPIPAVGNNAWTVDSSTSAHGSRPPPPTPPLHTLTDGGGVVLVPQQDFGSGVRQRAAGRVERLPRLKAVAEAKVGQLDHALLLEEHHVLRLQVPVDHVQPVAVGDGVDDLGEVALGDLEQGRKEQE